MNVNIIIALAYLVITMIAGRLIYAAMRKTELAPEDGTEAVMAGSVALMTGLLWPLALPLAVVMWRPPKTPAEVKAENERMREYIAELERDLGIGGDR